MYNSQEKKMKRLVDLSIKLGLVLLAFGVVIYVLIASKFWASDTQLWFLLAGDYQTVIIISIGVIAFGWVMKKLLQWEVRSALLPKRRRNR